MLLDILNDPEKPQGKDIRSLSIKNLQNDNDPKIVSSPQSLELLKRLRKLRLFITTERDEAAPENGIDKWDVHQFVIDLPFV